MQIEEIEKIEVEAPEEEKIAGEDTGTAPELNSAPQPTPEEEEAAGIDPASNPEPEPAAEPEAEVAQEPEPSLDTDEATGISEGEATATFTQSQVNEMIGRTRVETRDKTLKATFARYGVNSEEELDELFGDAQRFGTLRETYDADKKAWDDEKTSLAADREARDKEYQEIKERVALLESGIDKERFEDAKYILRGKGLEVTAENINSELATHPEWKKEEKLTVKEDLPFKKGTKISVPVLGNGDTPAESPSSEMSDRERAMKMFRVA